MSGLKVQSISAFYGDAQALWDVTFDVPRGRFVTLLGANGAGKTTTLKAICGLVPLAGGSIHYGGTALSGLPPHRVADRGLTLVPEGRQIFGKMTVEENLVLGSYLPRAKVKRRENLEKVYGLLPRLAERRGQLAETLSGGEQQMVAIARGLMQDPELIMFDEPSLGLAPLLVQEIFRLIQDLHRQGLTIFLVEQNVHHALKIADYGYVIENGRVVKEGSARDLEQDPAVREAYLGF